LTPRETASPPHRIIRTCQNSLDSWASSSGCKYYRDHAPPNFHATYGEHEITVEIESRVVQGRLPRRALAAVLDWYELHQNELRENWRRARAEDPLEPIEPLE